MATRSISAALLLGLTAGSVSTACVLPTAIPLTIRAVEVEHYIATSEAARIAQDVANKVEVSGVVPGNYEQSAYLRVQHLGNELHYQSTVGDMPDPCVVGSGVVSTSNGQLLAISCAQNGGVDVAAGLPVSRLAGLEIAVLVGAMAIMVGLITGIAVLRLLRPLSHVTRGIESIQAGDTIDFQPEMTGLAELDHLIQQVGAAAKAVEDRRQAIQARTQVVRELAQLLAHEVRNPLQSLELLTSLVAAEDDAEERRELASAIHSEIRVLDAVVQRMLKDGTRDGALWLTRAEVDVTTPVQHVFRLRTAEANAKGITLTKGTWDSQVLPIDRLLVRRSVDNLVANALQATPRGGTVAISVERQSGEVAIVVEDSGPGVPEELGKRIFEARVTGREGGTGLGLSLVRGVADAHGGSLEYHQSGLGGARFVLKLPRDATAQGEELVNVQGSGR